MSILPKGAYGLEGSSKVESIVLTKRGRRYATLFAAIIGVLEVVNPSNNPLWVVLKGIGSVFTGGA